MLYATARKTKFSRLRYAPRASQDRQRWPASIESQPCCSHLSHTMATSNVTFLYAPVGWQHENMGRTLYERGGTFRKVVDDASAPGVCRATSFWNVCVRAGLEMPIKLSSTRRSLSQVAKEMSSSLPLELVSVMRGRGAFEPFCFFGRRRCAGSHACETGEWNPYFLSVNVYRYPSADGGSKIFGDLIDTAHFAQPALFAVEVALDALWRSRGA